MSAGAVAVTDPATGEVVGYVQPGAAADVDAAVAAATAAGMRWCVSTPDQRAALLAHVARRMSERIEQFAAAITAEMGAPADNARDVQTQLAIDVFDSYATIVRTFAFEETLGINVVRYEPIGVVGAITPWNYPLYLAAIKIAAALAAGCTVVFKPSMDAPLDGALLAETIAAAAHDLGLPPGLVNLVNGSGSVVGEAISTHPGIAAVSFTGSTEAGRRVSAAAAATIKRVGLELGGKSAAIILDDGMDLESALAGALAGVYYNSGQTCTACTRILVPQNKYDDAVELGARLTRDWSIGDPRLAGEHIGPIATRAQYDTVAEYLRIGVAEGARLVAGGLPSEDQVPTHLRDGNWILPTLFADVSPGMTIERERDLRARRGAHRLHRRRRRRTDRQRHDLRPQRRGLGCRSRPHPAGSPSNGDRPRGDQRGTVRRVASHRRLQAVRQRTRTRRRRLARVPGDQDPAHPAGGAIMTNVNRRTFFAIGGAGSLVFALGACGQQPQVSATQIEGPPSGVTSAPPGPGNVERGRRGGSVVTAWTAEGNSYDPALGYDLHSWDAITSLLYTPLYKFAGQDGGPAPAAAAAMPDISADGTRYVIKLRPDFKFQNGRPIVAEDYVYAWRRVLDPATESWAAPYFVSIKGADEFSAGTTNEVSGLRAADDHTLMIDLKAADITFLGQLSQPYAAPLPREEVERLGDQFGRMPVGNGPFMITEYNTKDQRATFVRNPHFPWPGLPFLDQVTYRWGIDPTLQFLQLQHGDVDILGEGLTPSIAARVQGNATLREKFALPIPTFGSAWIAINMAGDKLADPRLRKALNWATDRDQLARISRGLQDPWGAIIPEHEPKYTRLATPYTYDLDKAKALMKDAGVSKLKLTFYCNEDDYWLNASQVLQQQWAPIGIDLDVLTLSNAAFMTAVANKEADVFGRSYYQVQPTGLDLLAGNFVTSGSSNYQAYSNPTVDELAAKSQGSQTVAESNGFLAQAEAIVTADAPGVFTGSLQFIGMRSPRVQNYHYRAETSSYYDRMWV